MQQDDESAKTGLDRRELLRRLMAGAGAAGAAVALPASLPAADHTGPAMPMPSANAAEAASGGMSLGSAEPPDPSLTSPDWKPKFFDDHQDQTVLAVADMMIPETDTPGARAAQVDRFIDLLLSTDGPGTGEDSSGSDFTDLLWKKGTLAAQKRYIAALNWLDGYTLTHYSKPFTALDQSHQETVLTLLTHATDDPEVGRGRELFAVIKSSIVSAYYSSEIGSLQELKYHTNPYYTSMPDECGKSPEGAK
jgi:Gluconate 2-dehydrogenase subunit 3